METNEQRWIDTFAQDLERRGSSAQVVKSYRRMVERALKDLGLLDVGPAQLRRWIDSHPRFKKESTKDHVRDIFVAFYDSCIARGEIDPPNPARQFKFVATNERTARSIDEQDIRNAISVYGKEGCWIALAAYQGLAPRHMAALTRESIDLEASPGILNVVGRGAKEISPNLHPQTLVALEKLSLPARGPLFPGMNAQDISSDIRAYLHETDIKVSAIDLQGWHRAQVRLGGYDFGRSFDSTVLDADLWNHVRRAFASADWPNVVAEATKFTEDRIRRWTGLTTAKTGGQLMVAAFGENGSHLLGRNDADNRGWHHFAMGLTMAVRNPAAHHIQERLDYRTYAASVLGACSLLLAQFRHDYPDKPTKRPRR